LGTDGSGAREINVLKLGIEVILFKLKNVFVIARKDFVQFKAVFCWLSLNCVDSNENNGKLPTNRQVNCRLKQL